LGSNQWRLNERLLQSGSGLGRAIGAPLVQAQWRGGQVEKNVRDSRHRMWQLMPAFPDLDVLNDWLEDRCKLLWAETAHGALPGSIVDVWEAEKPALRECHELCVSGLVIPPESKGVQK
jgi:hypothetical protein